MLTANQMENQLIPGADNEGEEFVRRPLLAEAPGGSVNGITFMLEFTLKAGEAPLRVLGAVQNFAGGEVILKVQGPALWIDWETLVGQEVSLHGEVAGGDQGQGLLGKVVRAKKREGGDSPAVLAVALTKLKAKDRQALEEQLLRPPKDIKGLWEHWDKNQDRGVVARVGSQSLYVVGLMLVVGASIMASRAASGYLPVLLLAMGGGMIAAKILWSFFKK